MAVKEIKATPFNHITRDIPLEEILEIYEDARLLHDTYYPRYKYNGGTVDRIAVELFQHKYGVMIYGFDWEAKRKENFLLAYENWAGDLYIEEPIRYKVMLGSLRSDDIISTRFFLAASSYSKINVLNRIWTDTNGNRIWFDNIEVNHNLVRDMERKYSMKIPKVN